MHTAHSLCPPRGASALTAEIILIFWRKEFFCFLLFYLGLFLEIIHEPLSLEEGTLAEDDSLQTQAYLVLDRREEVRQAYMHIFFWKASVSFLGLF